MRKDGETVVILDDLSGLWLAPIFSFHRITVFSVLHLELRRKDRWGFGHGWLSTSILRLSSRFVQHVFSVGKANTQRFPVTVEFIGNFVGRQFFDEKLSKEKVYDLGTVGRLAPEKNLDLFLHLVSRLSQRSARGIRAVIVGDGPQRGNLIALADSLGIRGAVTFLPWISRNQVPGMLDSIACFALTSRHEGFSTSLLESHARGLPSLVTSTSGYGPEFVEALGQPTGLVFDESDIADSRFLDSVLELIERHTDYEKQCIAKAAMFSEPIVLGKIERKLRDHFELI